MTVGILATIKVKPGKEAEFETVFRELAGQVKQNEPGCLLYDLFRSKTPSTYVVMEQYANAEALAAHARQLISLRRGPSLAPFSMVGP